MFKCPYCGVDILSEKAYLGHVEICPKNPKNIKKPETTNKEPVKSKSEKVKKDDKARSSRKG